MHFNWLRGSPRTNFNIFRDRKWAQAKKPNIYLMSKGNGLWGDSGDSWEKELKVLSVLASKEVVTSESKLELVYTKHAVQILLNQ